MKYFLHRIRYFFLHKILRKKKPLIIIDLPWHSDNISDEFLKPIIEKTQSELKDEIDGQVLKNG